LKKILTSPSSFGQIDSKPFDLLLSKGYEIVNNPYGRKLTKDEVVNLAKDCIGIVAGVELYSKEVIDSLPNLKSISRVGVGMDSIDLNYAKSKNINVLNTPDGPTRSVAEFTLAMALTLIRKIPMADSNMKNNIWKKETGNLILNKTLGVIGLGRIGKTVSKLFKAIGLNIIGYDLYPDLEWAEENNINILKKDDVISKADILTLHVPGNNNEPLISKKDFLKMKKDSILINISRGGIVNEIDLFDALKNNLISGAAVDVYSEEPYNGDLIKLNNIILTPHIGSYAQEGKLKMEVDAVNNLLKNLEKEL
jgi:D-3-phosphoglycerate dehydrogenase / 2-oxoglutarate reductase